MGDKRKAPAIQRFLTGPGATASNAAASSGADSSKKPKGSGGRKPHLVFDESIAKPVGEEYFPKTQIEGAWHNAAKKAHRKCHRCGKPLPSAVAASCIDHYRNKCLAATQDEKDQLDEFVELHREKALGHDEEAELVDDATSGGQQQLLGAGTHLGAPVTAVMRRQLHKACFMFFLMCNVAWAVAGNKY